MPHKASGKSRLEESKMQSHLGLVVYSSKENSKGKPIKYKKSNNSKTKSGRHNKWPQLKLAISTLAKDNKNKPAAPRKLNSYKANLNKHRKHL